LCSGTFPCVHAVGEVCLSRLFYERPGQYHPIFSLFFFSSHPNANFLFPVWPDPSVYPYFWFVFLLLLSYFVLFLPPRPHFFFPPCFVHFAGPLPSLYLFQPPLLSAVSAILLTSFFFGFFCWAESRPSLASFFFSPRVPRSRFVQLFLPT